MPTFRSPQEVYDTLGVFLTQITQEGDLRPKFVSADTSFMVTYTDPACAMKVDCTLDPPVVTLDPPDGTDAEIRLAMSADDAHKFWQGKLNMTVPWPRSRSRYRDRWPR